MCSAGNVTACLLRVAREVRQDLLPDFVGQECHIVRPEPPVNAAACASCGLERNLTIQLRRDDVQTAQHRHHVADLMPHDQVRKHREVDVRRRPGARPIRRRRCRRRPRKSPARRWAIRWRRTPRPPAASTGGSASPARNAGSCSRCCDTPPSDPGRPPCRSTSTLTGPGRQILDDRVDDLQAFEHLLHAHQVAGIAIAFVARRRP